MKIVVFGASGGVGVEAVHRAVAAGHEVTAFVRTPDPAKFPAGVALVQGDAFDAAAVATAITGQDAVISTLGSSNGMKASTELERMAENMGAGMSTAGVTRIVYCASAGVDNELTGVVGKGIMWMLRHALDDHRRALEALKKHQLELTVARPSSLTNAPFAPNYEEALVGVPAGMKPIPRASVADFMVRALADDAKYVGASVALAMPKQ